MRVVLHERPAVVVHAVASVNEQLAQVSGRHVCRDLHHPARPVFAEDFNVLQHTKGMLPDE